MAFDNDKWLALIEILQTGKPFVAEYLKVEWNNGANTKYYGTSAYADMSPFRDIRAYTDGDSIEARILGDPFQKFEINGDIRTENIDIVLNDHDGEVKADFNSYGGSRVELFRYYPQVDLHVSVWWGQILKPQIMGRYTQKSVLTNGYRSKERFLPGRLTPKEGTAIFGGKLTTAEQIRTNLCPWDPHIGGTNGILINPLTSEPFADCPKLVPADCTARFGHPGFFCGTDLDAAATVTDHPGNLAFSKGNSSSRNKPITWIFGNKVFRGAQVMLWAREFNQNHPEQGFVRILWRVSEGLIASVAGIKVNDKVVGFEHISVRPGARGQASPPYPGTIANFSGTALVFTRIGPVDPSTVTLASLSMECTVAGNAEVNVYTDEDTATRIFSNDRVWCLLEMYTNQKAGLGSDASRIGIPDWLFTSDWTRRTVTTTQTFEDGEEKIYTRRRTTFDAALEGRPAVEQIKDICTSGRISMPFQHDGKYSIVPLRAFTEDELAECRVFTDHGSGRNILWEGPEPVEFTATPDDKLTNEIALTFEEQNNSDVPRTITCSDLDQKARASKLLGDESFSTVPKQFSAVGVRDINEAVPLGLNLLWFGELETGGIKNNCFSKFRVPYEWTLGMKRYDPFRLDLEQQEIPPDPDGNPFEFFEVLNMRQVSANTAEIYGVAYNQAAKDAFEVESTLPGSCSVDGDCPAGYECVGGFCVPIGTACSVDNPCPVGFVCRNGVCVVGGGDICELRIDGSITYDTGSKLIEVPIEPC